MQLDKFTFNERRIIDFLRSRGGASRAELARALNVSPPTLTRLTATLLDKGLVVETVPENREKVLGQPSKILTLDEGSLYTIGIYFDPDSIHCCLANLTGKMVAYRTYPVGDRSFEAIMGDVTKITREMRAEVAIDRSRLLGYGLSYPGQYTVNPRYVFRIKQFASWPEVDIEEDFKRYFDGPVYHQNDAKAVCLAELYYGACQTYRNIAFIWLSYGIGGAVVIERQLYTGNQLNAAEFGGLFPKSKPRPSGQDLLDTLNRAGAGLGRLSEISEAHRTLPEMRSWIERSTEQLRWLSLVIARTLDPEAIVIGGTLPGWLLDEMVTAIDGSDTLGEDFFAAKPSILPSQFSRTPQIGASAIPIYHQMNPVEYYGPALKGW